MPRKPRPVAAEGDENQEVAPPLDPSATTTLADDPNHPTRWKHRRRLAYMAMWSMLALTVYVVGPWMPMDRLNTLQDVISWFYFSMASIVGAYMGFATWSAKTTRG